MSHIEAPFEMANLFPKHTGLPFVVWISFRGGARHDVRVKVSRNTKAGEFDRAVTGIEPADLTWDTLKLECGHTGLWCAKIRIDKTPPQREKCSECAKAWVAENTTEVTL